MPFALLSYVWLLQVGRILDTSFCCPSISRKVDISRSSSELQCLPISRLPIFLNHLLQNSYAQPALLFLAMPAINPPLAAFFLPPGVILPEQTPDAYMLAYAEGYTLNFLFAAAFPFAQSFAIMNSFRKLFCSFLFYTFHHHVNLLCLQILIFSSCRCFLYYPFFFLFHQKLVVYFFLLNLFH